MASVQAFPPLPAAPSRARASALDRGRAPRGLLGFVLLLFLLSCVFDPADRVFSLKVWIFMAAWGLTVLVLLSPQAPNAAPRSVPRELLLYVLLFMLVPLYSIVWFFLTDGSPRFEGFVMLKGYILISLAVMLVLNRINLLPLLCTVLTLLALAIIGVFVALQIVPALFAGIAVFGPRTGIVYVDNRDYGSGVTLLQVYFVTSPMLAMSIAYYFDRARSALRGKRATFYWTLFAINVAGMLLAGTRNNILISLLLPLLLWFLYARSKVIGVVLMLTALTGLIAVFAPQLAAFFDPTEVSNSAKLSLLEDYGRILSDPLTFLLGDGLGAYDQWQRGYLYVTEFTYFELIRNFGLPGAMIMFGLLLFPVAHAFVAKRPLRDQAIAVGFACYLLMCVSNPNLFSSMGILLMSVMLASIFLGNGGARALLVRRAP